MDKITQEIEDLAEKMQKSTVDPLQSSIDLIKSLGPVALRERIQSLSEDEKQTLKLVLTKAVEFDKEAQAVKFVQGKVTDTIIQEDKADDDADEKLVKPAAAVQNHQGNRPEGLQGQVIKGEVMKSVIDEIQKSDETMDQFISKMMEKGTEEQVIEKASKAGMDPVKVQGAVDKFKKKKNEEIEKAKPVIKVEVVEEPKDDDKKPDEKKEDVKKPNPFVKKSLTWNDPNALLKANTQGRNFHFDANAYEENQEVTQVIETELNKSMTSKPDSIDDMIEKSMDISQNEFNFRHERSQAKPSNGTLVKSFNDVEDIAAILGLTPEEALKILG